MVATIAPTQQEMMAWPYIGSDEESISLYKSFKPAAGHCWPFKDRLAAEELKKFTKEEADKLVEASKVQLGVRSDGSDAMIKKMLLKGETEIARRKFNEMKLWPADSWAGASDKSTAAGAATSKSLLGNLTGVLAAAAAMVAGPKPLFSIEGDGYMVVTDKRVLFLHYGDGLPKIVKTEGVEIIKHCGPKSWAKCNMALCTCDCDCIDVDEKITTDTLEDLITEALGMAQDGVFLRPGSELLQCKPFCCCLDCCGKCPSCCGCCLPCAPCLCASSYRLISRVTEKRSALVLANEKIEAVEFHMDTLAKMEAKVRSKAGICQSCFPCVGEPRTWSAVSAGKGGAPATFYQLNLTGSWAHRGVVAEVNVKNTTTEEMMQISSDVSSIIYGAHNGEHRNK